jgi:hypothetical protein
LVSTIVITYGPGLKNRRFPHWLARDVGHFESSELSETRVDFLGEAAALPRRPCESGGENFSRLGLHGTSVARGAGSQPGFHGIVEPSNKDAPHGHMIAPISVFGAILSTRNLKRLLLGNRHRSNITRESLPALQLISMT